MHRFGDGGPRWFDLDRPVLDGSEHFEVVPGTGGGWHPFSESLSRLLIRCPERGPAVRDPAHLPDDGLVDEAVHTELAALGWAPPRDEDGWRNWHRS